MRRRPKLALALLAGVALAGCGGGGGGRQLDVSAAASLKLAFTQYAAVAVKGTTVHYSFAGSDALAAQIEQGLRPDVFASADTALAQALFAKGLVERPRVFAANRLVVAVPRSSPVRSLLALARPGIAIATGTHTVPVGHYTDALLAALPRSLRTRLLANIRDREPDVTGIVGKLTQGAVDAGFLYATDVAATHGALRAIAVPAALSPHVAYAVAVVRGAANAAGARAFASGLLAPGGQALLRRAGFLLEGARP